MATEALIRDLPRGTPASAGLRLGGAHHSEAEPSSSTEVSREPASRAQQALLECHERTDPVSGRCTIRTDVAVL